MKIATWNLWNTHLRQSERLDAACKDLARLDADVVALQEVAAVHDPSGRVTTRRPKRPVASTNSNSAAPPTANAKPTRPMISAK